MTEVHCPLEEAAERHGDRPAVINGARVVSYSEFRRCVAQMTATLQRAGCRPGERIALFAPNSPDYLVWLLAVLRLGAVCCPMNTCLPNRTVADLLRRIDCRKLVAPAPAEDLGEVTGGVQVIQGRVLASAGESSEEGPEGSTVDLGRPATIVFTSGSTGTPKAVLHSYGNHYYNALGSNRNLPLAAGDRWLLDLPLYHVGGLGILFRCLLTGATVVMPDRGETLDAVLTGYGITHLSVVVTQLHRLLQQPESVRYPSLRSILLGGSPVPLKLLQRAAARGLPVFASYGCTEMASQVTTTGPDSTAAQRLTSGKLLPHRRLRIGDGGEIQLAGDTLFLGYVEGESLRCPVTDGGWLSTGDLGRLDDEGYLTVIGRRDNRFFSGGETIHPEEIERTLTDHDGVEQAVVVPVPDEEFGQRCVAFVQFRGKRPGGGVLCADAASGSPRGEQPDGVAGGAPLEPDSAALAAWLRRTLPRYKVPDAFYQWPDTDPGTFKIDRARFRRLAVDGPKTPLEPSGPAPSPGLRPPSSRGRGAIEAPGGIE